MKVLYVVDNLATDGGIQEFAKSTRQALELSVDVDLKSWSSPVTSWQKALVLLLPSEPSARLYASSLSRGIKRTLDRDRYDLVHFWNVKAAMAAVDTIRIPYVVTCHGFEVLRPNVAKYQYPTFMKTLAQASAITTPSGYTRNYIAQHYGITAGRIRVIHPGIEIPTTTVDASGATDRPKTVGTLTRIGGRKNVLRVIDALELLHSKGLNFNYCLAGTGPASAIAPILDKLKRVAFQWSYLGPISDEEKWKEFYCGLDVFALTPVETVNDVEGFGIVYIEANASGVPVVASNTGGIPDAVKPNVSGLFADPESPEDIASKIQSLLQSKQKWRMNARKWAENFSRRKTGAQFRELYASITGER